MFVDKVWTCQKKEKEEVTGRYCGVGSRQGVNEKRVEQHLSGRCRN